MISLSRRSLAATAAAAAMTVTAGLVVHTMGETDASTDSAASQPDPHANEAGAAVTATAAATEPRCFGAASMDRKKPCANPALSSSLTPRGVAAGRAVFALSGSCFSQDDDPTLATKCSFGKNKKAPLVVIVGDSHARAFTPALVTLAKQGKIRLRTLLKGGCQLADSTRWQKPARKVSCAQWKPKAVRWITKRRAQISAVVVTGYAPMAGTTEAKAAANLVSAWRPLTRAGIRVVAVSDNPVFPDAARPCLEKKQRWTKKSCATARAGAFPVGNPYRRAARSVASARYLNTIPQLCTAKRCLAWAGGVMMYRDHMHLTTTYTRTMAPMVWRQLRRWV